MKIVFSKYQGAGNDFILINNLDGQYSNFTEETIQFLCNRKFGIGADGVILINQHPDFHYEVDYSNADGSKSFCGNGGRCAIAFASKIGINQAEHYFLGYDGKHLGRINNVVTSGVENQQVHLKMNDVNAYIFQENYFEINTGSPHYLVFGNGIEHENLIDFGRRIRYSPTYSEKGINVNLVEIVGENQLFVRTYERGVEDETLACGTGVTACAIAYAIQNNQIGENKIMIKTLGGNLAVHFHYDGEVFTNIWLIGPAEFVFEGTIHLPIQFK